LRALHPDRLRPFASYYINDEKQYLKFKVDFQKALKGWLPRNFWNRFVDDYNTKFSHSKLTADTLARLYRRLAVGGGKPTSIRQRKRRQNSTTDDIDDQCGVADGSDVEEDGGNSFMNERLKKNRKIPERVISKAVHIPEFRPKGRTKRGRLTSGNAQTAMGHRSNVQSLGY
jgi:hypothetical protein